MSEHDIAERAATATIDDLLKSIDCESCRPIAAAELARRAEHPRPGHPCSTDEATLAPCPYCTCLMAFLPDPEGDPRETTCYRCGRPLKLTWTETSVIVRVDQRRTR